MTKAKYIRKVLVVLFAIICSVSIAGQASAQIIMPLDVEISGADMPNGSTPWVTATFIDVSTDNVRLTMSASNLTGVEFINQWYFNSLVTSGLTFTAYDISAIYDPTISLASNSYQADGDGLFDIKFDFSNVDDGSRFEAGETVIYDISGTGISASTFNTQSFTGGGAGTYTSAAQIGGITVSDPGNVDCNAIDNSDYPDCGSGWIANTTVTVVPEPISSTLFIVGGATLGFRRFRKKFNK